MKDELTPAEIVEQLDKYIVGQKEAKKAVAIALRNRYRRRKLPPEFAQEIAPKNIIMIGPTGVGKTEIARRLSKLTSSPFVKVEATKFTERGYVGRDVSSMVRDLVDLAVDMVKREKMEEVKRKAMERVEEEILDILVRPPRKSGEFEDWEEKQKRWERTRDKFKEKLRNGELDERIVEVELSEKSFSQPLEIFSSAGMEEIGMSIQELIPGLPSQKKKKRKMKIEEAKKALLEEEQKKMVDMDEVISEAVRRVEQTGIIFIDELDKIAGRESGAGPDVSREGVQRDLLPIVEGTNAATKYGLINTEHILFIAAGAFHISKPSDLIPELQGRFPIRVELKPLEKEDFKKILIEPRNSLVKQYKSLMETEGIEVEFTQDAIDEIASVAEQINNEMENIGARRLHTIMEKVMEEISFFAPELTGQKITINREYVKEKIREILKKEDLKKYIL